jgi:hypothetical protein
LVKVKKEDGATNIDAQVYLKERFGLVEKEKQNNGGIRKGG